MPFPGTDPAKLAEMGETMAQTRIRLACNGSIASVACPQLSPSVNLMFDDEWTDPAASPAPSVYLRYADAELAFFGTNAPAKPACQASWNANCRTIINYETHIHPLWSQPRTNAAMQDRTCTTCHGDTDPVTTLPQVPAAQLDLGDGPSDQNPDHFKSYHELLFNDDRQTLVDGVLVDETVEVFVFDENGNQLFQTMIDPVTGEEVLVLDPVTGQPIPLTTLEPVPANGPSMRVAGSRSSYFMDRFLPGGSHEGDLTASELRLIAEWLDIGAQYFNDPFKAPLN